MKTNFSIFLSADMNFIKNVKYSASSTISKKTSTQHGDPHQVAKCNSHTNAEYLILHDATDIYADLVSCRRKEV
jgi:hypothetical protein